MSDALLVPQIYHCVRDGDCLFQPWLIRTNDSHCDDDIFFSVDSWLYRVLILEKKKMPSQATFFLFIFLCYGSHILFYNWKKSQSQKEKTVLIQTLLLRERGRLDCGSSELTYKLVWHFLFVLYSFPSVGGGVTLGLLSNFTYSFLRNSWIWEEQG